MPYRLVLLLKQLELEIYNILFLEWALEITCSGVHMFKYLQALGVTEMGEAGMVVELSPFSEDVGMGNLDCVSCDWGRYRLSFFLGKLEIQTLNGISYFEMFSTKVNGKKSNTVWN